MPNYGAAVVATPAAAAGAAYATFHTVARRARIYKIIDTNTQTVFSQVGLIRSSNTPVATTSIVPQQYDPADIAATCLLDIAWSTPPTVAANTFLEEFCLGPAQGAGIEDVWQSDKEITLAIATWLVFWNPGAGAGGIQTLTVAYDE